MTASVASARPVAARRIRILAATTVVAAVAGTASVPVTAFAADQAQASGKPLTMTLGAPTPGNPLKRGGATESMTLKVTNSSDKAQEFSSWLLGEADGPSPLLKDSVVFDVTALDAPATKSRIGRQGGAWQGLFFPATGDASDSFSIPAKTEFTWKVTVGLGANYPTNDGNFTLIADALEGDVDADRARNTVVFKTDPQITPGKLNLGWERDDNVVARPGQRTGLTLNATATGPGEFPAELSRTVSAQGFREAAGHPDFLLEAEVGGKIVKLKEINESEWELPAIPKGFSAASGKNSIKLYLSVGKNTDIKEDAKVPLEALFSMEDAWGFNGARTEVTAGPAKPASSSPSASPSPSASTSPSPSASASTSATPSPSTSTTPAATTTTTTTTDNTTTTGSLANTGSSANKYAALATALVTLGAVATWLGTRRRRETRA
ncbi:LPXTG cell wall anchor domain-containing protein [Streptomyces aurantiogriseus]|uniref:Gram-positive cocci surface proteins LPxTG domain-containing protein n=1 Tax=Streptomyces aurantiogriseus TaxID=66870 RepID=A0A918BSS8_9ACTN|nr:LPXTG cell wall anchor domain-containing protein [Streptomyces aurantiogriseus]GGQ90563.1 hypothetical protein GCM10010251_00950 [Streptomyces aurantiogriseus]